MYVIMVPSNESKDKAGVPFVMKMRKSLYGLAQSPHWWNTIDPSVVEIGSVPLKSDTCIYIYNHNGTIIILTLYVDDVLLIVGNITVLEAVKTKLISGSELPTREMLSLYWECRSYAND